MKSSACIFIYRALFWFKWHAIIKFDFYSRRTVDPNVNPPEYCYIDDDGNFNLKDSHDYYYQIQCQMHVLGYDKGRFVV